VEVAYVQVRPLLVAVPQQTHADAKLMAKKPYFNARCLFLVVRVQVTFHVSGWSRSLPTGAPRLRCPPRSPLINTSQGFGQTTMVDIHMAKFRAVVLCEL